MKLNYTIALTCFVLFIVSFAGAQESQADQLLEDMVKEKGVKGITAGYSIDGKIAWSNAFGYSCPDDWIVFTKTTLTRTASIAKSMTSIAIMQLMEQGLIDLDAPITTYLKDFPTKKKGEITVRHLLGHTSGIPGYASSKETESQKEYPTLKEAMAVFVDRDLDFEPGTKFSYTTYGYVVLGRIIEEVSGQNYEEYMKQHIWGKAGMTRTGVEKYTEEYENKSCLFHHRKKSTKPGVKNNLSNRVPGGGLYSNLADLIKFGNAVIDHTFISAETYAIMTEIQFKEKEGNPYACGWYLYGPAEKKEAVIGHSGEQTGVSAQLMIVPGSKVVVVVLANTSGRWRSVVNLSSKLIRIAERQIKQ